LWGVVIAVLLVGTAWRLRPAPQQAEADTAFDGERALILSQQLSRLDRQPGAKNRQQAIAQLQRLLDEQVDQTALQNFVPQAPDTTTEQPPRLTNIVGRQNPSRPRRVLLATRWDPLPVPPGTPRTDDTSGLALLLELARLLKHRGDLPVGVDYVLFDGHDRTGPEGQQGSKYFRRMLKSLYPRSRPEYALVVDRVGNCDQRFLPEKRALARSPQVVLRLWGAAEDLGWGAHFPATATISVDHDHLALHEGGLPSVLLVDSDYPTWHTQQDSEDKVCASSLERAGQVLLHVLLEQESPHG
jgi:hypothetical protein